MINETLKIKEENEYDLLQIPGVIGVGVRGNGHILIYVPEITPQLKAQLPKTLDGTPTLLVRTGGKFVPLPFLEPAKAIYSMRTERYRPAPGGVSCGHPQVTAGTLSCRAFDKNKREILGLSNNHVIALDWGTEHVGSKGDNILQPGPYDGGKDPDDKIGELNRWVPVKLEEPNLVDSAAFKSSLLADGIEEVGKPAPLSDPYVGMKVLKSGRTTGLTFGEILDVNATIVVSGWGDCTFKDQITMTKMLESGDSGSWVGSQDTFQTVGLGHAGSPNLSVACKGVNVQDLLGVEIIPPTRTLPWYTVLGAWASVISIAQVAVGAWNPFNKGGLA